MHDGHTYLIDLTDGGSVIVAGDSVYLDPGGLVVRCGEAVTATLSRAEYMSIGPWAARSVAPRHVAAPDPHDPASTVVLTGAEVAP